MIDRRTYSPWARYRYPAPQTGGIDIYIFWKLIPWRIDFHLLIGWPMVHQRFGGKKLEVGDHFLTIQIFEHNLILKPNQAT